jgi:rhodanese-related sulfurtransferase
MSAVRFKEATPAQVAEVRGQVRLVDVREPAEYTGELSHIAEAELVPLATVLDAVADWDRKAPIVLVCRSGARSGRAAQALVSLGFEDVTNMVGGMIAWNEARLPVA